MRTYIKTIRSTNLMSNEPFNLIFCEYGLGVSMRKCNCVLTYSFEYCH